MSAPPPDRGPERDGDRERDAVDAAWAEIVARWDTAEPPVGAWPAQEDTDPDAPTTPRPPARGPERDVHGWAQDQPRDPSRERPAGPPAAPAGPAPQPPRAPAPLPHDGLDDVDRDEDAGSEHYQPPPPPPLPRAGWRTWLPWAGVLGAPALLLLLVLVGQRPSGVPLLLAVAAFAAGFITLVARMPASRDGDDDDGAVV